MQFDTLAKIDAPCVDDSIWQSFCDPKPFIPLITLLPTDRSN